jgi:ABC-type branched-subunit amino acid transport system permease subunit
MKTMNRKSTGLWIALLAACAAVPLVFDPESSYVVYFLFMAFTYVALSQAWNIVAGYTGQVSLGHITPSSVSVDTSLPSCGRGS